MSHDVLKLQAELEAQMAALDAIKARLKEAKRNQPIKPHFSGNGLIVLPGFFKKGNKPLAFYPAQWEKLFGTEQMAMIRELIEQSKQLKTEQGDEEVA